MRSISRRRGFTLMEAMIASAILALAVVGVSSTMVSASQAQDAEEATTNARILASELLEEATAVPLVPPDPNVFDGFMNDNPARSTYQSLRDYSGYMDVSPVFSLGYRAINLGDGRTYTRHIAIEYRDTPAGPAVIVQSDFAMVTVSVTWPGGAGVSLSKLVTSAPPSR